MLGHNDHNWRVAQVGAFSGHCETSRRFVDSSTSACSTMTLAGNWHMSSSSHLLSTRYLVDGRYCSYWCYNDNVTWWAGGMERRGGGRWRQDDWQLLVSTLRWLRDPRLQDYYHLFQISWDRNVRYDGDCVTSVGGVVSLMAAWCDSALLTSSRHRLNLTTACCRRSQLQPAQITTSMSHISIISIPIILGESNY